MVLTDNQPPKRDVTAKLAALLMSEPDQPPRVRVAGGRDALAGGLIGAAAGALGMATDAKVRGDKSIPAQVYDHWQKGPTPDDQGLERGMVLPIARNPQTNTLSPAVPGMLYYPFRAFEDAMKSGTVTPGAAAGMAGMAMPGVVGARSGGRIGNAIAPAVPDLPPGPQPRGIMQGVPNVYQKPQEYFPNEIQRPSGPPPVPATTRRQDAAEFGGEMAYRDALQGDTRLADFLNRIEGHGPTSRWRDAETRKFVKSVYGNMSQDFQNRISQYLLDNPPRQSPKKPGDNE